MLHNPGVESSKETYPERLTTVITAKGDSYIFSSVKNGNHVLFRVFSYIKARAHNRASFIHILRRCFRHIGKNLGRPNASV
uniref:Centriolar satellite-associated tubulin polyglutamylase complex regulator 1 n=1 Tax=Salmo trutta TaxID=8032 RepID=A0A674F570_SALTR